MLKKLRLSLRGRDGKPMSQKQLAKLLGLPRAEVISKIERGEQKLTAEMIVALSRIFNVDPSIFVGTEGRPRGMEEEAQQFQPAADSFNARIPLGENQFWYRVLDSRLDEIGIVAGDEMVIDIGHKAQSGLAIGDVVIANLYYPDGKSAETILRQWVPPQLLITNSLHRNLPPLNLARDSVSVLGVVVHPRRNTQSQKIIPFLRS